MNKASLVLLLLLHLPLVVFSKEKEWTVQNSPGVRYFIDEPNSQDWAVTDKLAIGVSPDRRHFFFIAHYGDVSCDCYHYELMIYSVAEVRRALAHSDRLAGGFVKPLHTIRMSSTAGMSSRRRAMLWPSWQDTSTLVLLGTGERGEKFGLYKFNLDSGQLKRMSSLEHDVVDYDIHGEVAIYNTYAGRPLARDARDAPVGYNHYPVQPLRRDALRVFLENQNLVKSAGTFVSLGGEVHTVLPVSPYWVAWGPPERPHLSPDKRWAVVPLQPTEAEGPIPQGWEQYAGLEVPYEDLTLAGRRRLWRFALVDMHNGQPRTILNAPVGPLGDAVTLWSADSKHVVIANTMLPLTEDVGARRNAAYVVDYAVDSRQICVIEPMQSSVVVKQVGWLARGRELLIAHVDAKGEAAGSTVYKLRAGRWQGRAARAGETTPPKPAAPVALPDGLSVQLRQSMNDPPVVMAAESSREVALTEEDPALKGIHRVRVEGVQWTERNGYVASGGFLLPEGAAAGKPLPLVIQLQSSLATDLFRPDGAASTAFAAQALAAQGMAVLQMDMVHFPGDDKLTPRQQLAVEQEGALTVERVDAAVESLASRGLVDPKLVGLVGFSRTGYLVNYLITHPRTIVPAAAIVADSVTQDYGMYMYFNAIAEDNLRDRSGTEISYGGSLWAQKQKWLDHAPGFNVDRVETPALFTYNFWPSVLTPVETLGAFRLNKREIDMLLFPDGGHQLQRPLQRIASMQSTVDWMEFWLQGKEDSTDEKSAQYRYWRQLREQRNARWAKEGNPY